MKTDRELLELAAKAAGYRINETYADPYYPENCKPDYEDHYEKTPALLLWSIGVWSPLTDDGDALRLASSLKLDILFRHGVSGVTSDDGKFSGFFWESFDEESDVSAHLAATRRAIVRAAAATGETE